MLKRILEILPAVCLATSMAASAQSPFIGQWTFDSSRSRTPDEMKVQSLGGDNTPLISAGVRKRSWRMGRPARPPGNLPLGEAGSAGHVDRSAQERWTVDAESDMEAFGRRQYADGLLPRVRVGWFDVEPGLCLPAHR